MSMRCLCTVFCITRIKKKEEIRLTQKEKLPAHWIKGKTCKSLARKLCRYYRKSGGGPEFLPVLSAFLECSLGYLAIDGKPDEFCFSSLEMLARTVRQKNNISRFEIMMSGHDTKAFNHFQDVYTDCTQQDLVMALQRIMNYLEQYHGKATIRFVLKK